MHNPLEQFTRKKEQQINVDHAFLDRLEEELLPRSTRRWNFVFLAPAGVVAAFALIVAYGVLRSDETPAARATELRDLFMPDTDKQLRRIQFQRTTNDSSETETLWTAGASYRQDTVSENAEHSLLIDATERQQCSRTQTTEQAASAQSTCFDLSEAAVHAGLRRPTGMVSILDADSTDGGFTVRWSTERPISALTITHGVYLNGHVASTAPRISKTGERFQEEYYNQKKDGMWEHRVFITQSVLQDALTFQLIPTIGGRKRHSQVLQFDRRDETVSEVQYDALRTYPVFDFYRKTFRIPLYIVEHEELFADSVVTQFEERDGRTIAHRTYTVPTDLSRDVLDVLWDERIATVDFWYEPHASQLLRYESRTAEGELMERIDVIEDTVVDAPPDSIVSLDAWLKE